MELGKKISKGQALGAVRCLWEHFGGTVNAAGYKVLDERVGLIYGDSITFDRAQEILHCLKGMGFASSNVVFGRGSFGSVYNTRDSTGSAMKATYGEVNGEPHELFKDPITDSGSKRSAKGLLRVEEENGTFVLYDQQTWEQEASGALQTVFEDGRVFNVTTLAEVRRRVGFINM
jgi:nicotinamide phosphoribosyltransferase